MLEQQKLEKLQKLYKMVHIVLYGPAISQSDCRKACPYQLPYNNGVYLGNHGKIHSKHRLLFKTVLEANLKKKYYSSNLYRCRSHCANFHDHTLRSSKVMDIIQNLSLALIASIFQDTANSFHPFSLDKGAYAHSVDLRKKKFVSIPFISVTYVTLLLPSVHTYHLIRNFSQMVENDLSIHLNRGDTKEINSCHQQRKLAC